MFLLMDGKQFMTQKERFHICLEIWRIEVKFVFIKAEP